jgi:hypothetical protein
MLIFWTQIKRWPEGVGSSVAGISVAAGGSVAATSVGTSVVAVPHAESTILANITNASNLLNIFEDIFFSSF